MSCRLLNKINVKLFRQNFCRTLSIQHKVNESNSSYHTNHLSYNNTNFLYISPFTKHRNESCLLKTPNSLIQNIQKRNVSNFINSISEWPTVQFAQKIILQVHDVTGLPWWATIIFTAITARTIVTLPFSIMQLRTATKLQNLKYEMEDNTIRFKREAAIAMKYDIPEGLIKRELRHNIKKEWNALVVRENCHPAKIYVLILIQVPLWISFSFAIRNLCNMIPQSDPSSHITYMEMMSGGFGWIVNLTTADQYMLLPIILGSINLLIIEVHRLFRTVPEQRKEKFIRYFFQTLSVLLTVIATNFPAAVNIYWLSSSIYGLTQAFLIQSTRLRRLCRVPTTENCVEHPYRHFYGNLKSRLRLTGQ